MAFVHRRARADAVGFGAELAALGAIPCELRRERARRNEPDAIGHDALAAGPPLTGGVLVPRWARLLHTPSGRLR